VLLVVLGSGWYWLGGQQMTTCPTGTELENGGRRRGCSGGFFAAVPDRL